jgi:hypothetical protein
MTKGVCVISSSPLSILKQASNKQAINVKDVSPVSFKVSISQALGTP